MSQVTTRRAPRRIEQAVREHALGPLRFERRFTHPVVPAAVHLGGALVTVWAYQSLETLAADREGELSGRMEATIEAVGLALTLFGAFLVLAAVLVLNAGQRAVYLCTGGLVEYRNGRALAYPWAEIETLLLVRHQSGDRTGEIYRYRLVPRHGRPITIPVRPAEGARATESVWPTEDHGPFNESLIEAMVRAGRPVSDR